MWKQQIKARKYAGDYKTISETLLMEIPICIEANSEILYETQCTPQSVEDLAIGVCVAKNKLNNVSDISKITKKNNSISLTITKTSAPPKKQVSKKDLKPKEIMALMFSFQEKAMLYKETGLAESAALVDDKELIIFSDDLSRKNALYKCIGKAVNEKRQTEGLTVILSGKICSEIMSICCDLTISRIISRTGLTEKAYTLAKENNIEVIGFCRGKHFTIFV